MANISKVYLGSCSVAGAQLACTSMSAGMELRPGFYDHVIGKLDSTGSSKGKGGSNTIQKRFWRYMPGVAKISVSGVGTEGSLSSLIGAAFGCTEISAACSFTKTGTGAQISQGYISSLTIDCRAGDNINFSVEVTGKKLTTGGGGAAFSCKRLANWQSVKVSSGAGDTCVGFSLTVTNPIKPVYTSKEGFYADDLRVGIQEVTGSVSSIESNILLDGEDTISFSSANCAGFSKSFRCVFDGTKNTGDAGGIFIATTNFTAVT